MSVFSILRKKGHVPRPWEKYYTSKELNIEVPDISMYQQVKDCAAKYPNNKAIVYQGRTIKYSELMAEIEKTAKAFHKAGLREGMVVSICMPNTPEVLFSLYAVNKLGAIANMIHPLSAEEEIKEAINSTNSSFLVCLDLFSDKIAKIVQQTRVKTAIVASATDSLNVFVKLGYKFKMRGKIPKLPPLDVFKRWSQFIKDARTHEVKDISSYGKNQPAVILHSGGTTGKSKNVVIQNRAFVYEGIQEGIILWRLKPGDCCMAIMPNFHGFGLSVCMHTPLVLGCYTILVPQFDSNKFDVLFEKNKPNIVLGVPTLYEALISNNNVRNFDLSYLKYAISGGDLLPKSLEDRINAYFKEHGSNTRITQGYGMSEALAAVCLAHDEVEKSGSIGVPLPGNLIKIIDPTTRETVPYGQTGEIVIHSKSLMMGYLDNEVETNAALQIHDDGYVWLHSGDLGIMDEDGFIFFKGRQKRMIISSGYNVFPSHVEEIIEKHPAVLQCTVVGKPHPYKQEVCKAFIVLKEGNRGPLVKHDIKEYCKKNLAKYMVPAEFVYRKHIPKTKFGKVDFKVLEKDTGGDDE